MWATLWILVSQLLCCRYRKPGSQRHRPPLGCAVGLHTGTAASPAEKAPVANFPTTVCFPSTPDPPSLTSSCFLSRTASGKCTPNLTETKLLSPTSKTSSLTPTVLTWKRCAWQRYLSCSVSLVFQPTGQILDERMSLRCSRRLWWTNGSLGSSRTSGWTTPSLMRCMESAIGCRSLVAFKCPHVLVASLHPLEWRQTAKVYQIHLSSDVESHWWTERDQDCGAAHRNHTS